MIDYGAVYSGYHSDETWTFVVGRGDEKQKEAYLLVKKAHDTALHSVKAGVPCKDVDRIARDCIESEKIRENTSLTVLVTALVLMFTKRHE